MNAAETTRALRLATAMSPHITLVPQTRDAWLVVLADVTLDQALTAIAAHYATSTNWVMPADIRRHVAAELGLLPPTWDQAQTDPLAHPFTAGRTWDSGYDYRDAARTETEDVLRGNLAAQAAALARLPDLPPHPGPEPWLDRDAWAARSLLGNARIVDDWRDRLYARRDARTGRDALRERLTTAARAVPPSAGTNGERLLDQSDKHRNDFPADVTRRIPAPIEPA
jgi:hypothetical protein